MKSLNKIILGMPHRLLKATLYAWLGILFYRIWPPVIIGILLGIVVLGLGLMAWQKWAWEDSIRREFHSGETKPFIDHPHVARKVQVRNLLLVLAASGLVGWLLNGLLTLNGLLWFLLFAGFTLLSRNTVLFGAGLTYIITDQGIGIRYVPGRAEYRLFFKFNEIWRAEWVKVTERIPQAWDVLTPQGRPKEGVLLSAVRREGFSKQVRSEVLVAPMDMDGFLEKLRGHVEVVEEAPRGSD
jgi:hypothetical protein